MAAVTLSCTADGNTGEVSVYYSSTGTLPRGFGINVTLNNDANIVSASDFNDGFWVAPGSVDVNDTTGEIDSGGNRVASAVDYPGVTLEGPPDGNGMTIEMGSLYVGAPNAPASSGLLFTFIVDKECTVTLSGNSARGNVVLEDATEDSTDYGSGCTVTFVCPTCLGDVDGDTYVTTTDFSQLLYYLANAYTGYQYYPAETPGHKCQDLDADTYVTTTDLSQLLYYLANAPNPGNWWACGDPCAPI
jgi:hypothetical protein